jgi:hypothetical protein
MSPVITMVGVHGRCNDFDLREVCHQIGDGRIGLAVLCQVLVCRRRSLTAQTIGNVW